MDLPELISRSVELAQKGGLAEEEARHLTEERVLAYLQQAEVRVFQASRGLDNPEIAQALEAVLEDTISPDRTTVKLPAGSTARPTAHVEDEEGILRKAHRVSQGGAVVVNEIPAYIPAFSISGTKIEFFLGRQFKKGDRQITVDYYRAPGRMMRVGGLRGGIDLERSFGAGKNKSFKAAVFTKPVSLPGFEANALQGATLSMQLTETDRKEYRIEEHAAGQLDVLWVSEGQVIKDTDLNWTEPRSVDDFRITIWRTSDLPASMHGLIVEEAVNLLAASRPAPAAPAGAPA